jgi:hypothetical protein
MKAAELRNRFNNMITEDPPKKELLDLYDIVGDIIVYLEEHERPVAEISMVTNDLNSEG